MLPDQPVSSRTVSPWTRRRAGYFAGYVRAAVLLAIASLSGVPVAAQSPDLFTGSWSCQHSMEPYSGNAYDKHFWQYRLDVHPGGTWQLSGLYDNPVVGQTPVQGSGNWQAQSGAPAADFQGQIMRGDGSVTPYVLMLNAADERNLYVQFRGNTHMWNATCQR